MSKRLLVHIHVYYQDLFNQLADVVNAISLPKKVIITYVDRNLDKKIILDKLPDAELRLVDNVGYDIKPFIDVVNSVDLNEFSYVLKLHTKRNYNDDLSDFHLDNGVCVGGTKWRDYLLRPFVRKNIRKTLDILSKQDVGGVGDINCLLTSKHEEYANYTDRVKSITQKLGMQYKDYSFLGGTMFMIKANLLKVLSNVSNIVTWQKSSVNRDWQNDIVYAMERVLGEIIIAQGKKLVGVGKKTRDKKNMKVMHLVKKKEFLDGDIHTNKYYFCGVRVLKKIWSNSFSKTYLFKFCIRNKKKNYIMSEYGKWINDLHQDKSLFVPITNKPFKRKKDTPKIFAYYLTQFHAIPENDMAHGKGFTEWTNVASCVPQFVGHVQPKIPYDVGFYNLLDINVMKRQAELAKMYGVYGWCFYYYWFSGKKVLEKPLYNFLNSDIDLHFHFCWANENWSKLWDGGNKEVILEQKLQEDDAKKFYNDILPFIKDKRYEKIDNKPLLSIYRPTLFEKDKLKRFMVELDALAKTDGFDGFYFMAHNVSGFNTPQEYGFNGIIEFPPHGLHAVSNINKKFIGPETNLALYDMTDYVHKQHYIYDAPYEIFKCCFPEWDNSPRKTYSNGWVLLMPDGGFKNWLSGIIEWTRQHNDKNKQYIYINAWNEWGEGAILEPTTRYGYKNLDIVKQCLEGNE